MGDGKPWLYGGGISVIVGAFLQLFLPVSTFSQDTEGYDLLSSRVEVRSAIDWQAWEAPVGARVIHHDGTVTPTFLRSRVNVVANAPRFEYVLEGDTLKGGIRRAGSNHRQAHLAMDGDHGSCWEPDRGDHFSLWWIEVDLARAVIAERIVVKFAPEGQGDPFLQFRVMISDGRQTFTGDRSKEFFRVGQVNQPNKDQREFEFEVTPRRKSPPGVVGEVAQFIRMEALGTDGPRGQPVTEAEYSALDSLDRGAIDFFRRTSAGRQIRIDADLYGQLPAEEQGEIRHYRRERPRLAEIEVYAVGDNVVRQTRAPLRHTDLLAERDPLKTRPYTDGLFFTHASLREYDPVKDENQLLIDLGVSYWLNRIRLMSPEDPLPAYQVRVSDGSNDAAGRRIWEPFEALENREEYLHLEEEFRLQEVRYIEVKRLALSAATGSTARLSEVHAFGEGYVPSLVMTSPIITLGRPRLFSTVTWDADTPLNTSVEVRTRSGNELLRVAHYFSHSGFEIPQKAWENRSADRRGPLLIEELPAGDWSNWSDPHRASGDRFRSPSPRRYLQAMVVLSSGEPERAASIRSLRFGFEPPLVDHVFAEVWPIRDVAPGKAQLFTLYVKPMFASGNPGFDRLTLASSSEAPIELKSVVRGSEAQTRTGAGEQLWPGGMTASQGANGELHLRFEETVNSGGHIYAVRFRTELFLSNTEFSAVLSNTSLPERVQHAGPGEAQTLVESESLVAVARLDPEALLGNPRIKPRIFTPNGDGVNDVAEIETDVFVVEGDNPVSIRVFDLSGRCVRTLSLTSRRPSGRHRVAWDGRSDRGRMLPPGTYAVRVSLETDADPGGTTAVRLLRLIY